MIRSKEKQASTPRKPGRRPRRSVDVAWRQSKQKLRTILREMDTLTEKDLSGVTKIAELVQLHCGVQCFPDRAWRLLSRLQDRMQALEIDQIGDYIDRVNQKSTSEKGEIHALAEALRVGETGWFRHSKQFKAIARELLPRLERTAENTTLRFWSAGCGSGQEAYSLAMTASDRWKPGEGRFSILGTDLSAQAIATARRAVWPSAEIKALEAGVRDQNFTFCNGHCCLRPEIRRTCRFEIHNLMADHYPGNYDLILCRNVLIYFSDDCRKAVLRKLSKAIKPGGYLVLGYSESLSAMPALLNPQRFGDSLFWQRPSDGPTANRSKRTSPPPTTPPLCSAPTAKAAKNAQSDCTVMELEGAFPPQRINVLTAKLRKLLSSSPQTVVLNLTRVEYLCAEVAVHLRRAAVQQSADGGRFVLLAQRAAVRRWVDRFHLEQWMEVREDLESVPTAKSTKHEVES
jgi:chemotaxis protein methyltransferase CheR